MARTLALCALLGVVGIVSAGSYNNNNSTAPKCAAKKYNVEGILKDPILFAADASGMYSGFIIDYLELMKNASNGTFDYQLTARSDGNYRALVDDLANKKFDMVAADLNVRSDRIDRIDFLVSYLRSQVRILTNNNPTSDPNFANAVVGAYPTWYVEDDANVVGFLQTTKNATLQAAYKSAKDNGRVVDINTGAEAVQSSNSPAALIGTTPTLTILNGQSTATALTSDILETHRFALAIQKGQTAQLLCLNKLSLMVQENGSVQQALTKYGLD